jgi:hypothetical protein
LSQYSAPENTTIYPLKCKSSVKKRGYEQQQIPWNSEKIPALKIKMPSSDDLAEHGIFPTIPVQ